MPPKLDLRVNTKTVQQGTVEKLKDAILSGMFQPGDRLVEANLCASLGVSRPSLREALRSLQAERLIEIVPNRGPQIPVLSWKSAEEIYDVRALLEGEAAARCAVSIDAPDVAALSAALAAFRKATRMDDPGERIRTTAEFYAIILRNCGNQIIEQLLESLLARINFLRAKSMSLTGRSRKSYEEMNAIFTAIKKKDPEKAREAARLHVANARDAAKKSFQEM
ncbi:GntR family transcriptional regulator [Pseudorhodoplanes sp.]|uniref:GntR family transcriptional regulator n=1 Tax=Pseudorhodoplanes sp. TaxID=1934341 RepID=UPI002C64120C|nr:GntR family transcriptional regulator [Pseudorhodoplanes sp.]HWV55397.1 GntR family transcriptional regulator [Pseudorhodoplanes sp.]